MPAGLEILLRQRVTHPPSCFQRWKNSWEFMAVGSKNLESNTGNLSVSCCGAPPTLEGGREEGKEGGREGGRLVTYCNI